MEKQMNKRKRKNFIKILKENQIYKMVNHKNKKILKKYYKNMKMMSELI